ncbi:hypothetical protein [[Phormidium] sp. LEGE 05292]|nr:hypothetical protein [Phormidium sp. LEGE 05292]
MKNDNATHHYAITPKSTPNCDNATQRYAIAQLRLKFTPAS